MKRCAVVAAAWLTAAAQAGELSCYRDPATDAMHCIDPAEVRERDGLRSAPLYRGGPQRVHRTSTTLHVDCKLRTARLKDADGVTYAGGPSSATPLLETLTRELCLATVRPPAKR